MNGKAKRYARNILKKAKENMTDVAFLKSDSMQSFLERMARNISGNYSIKVQFGSGVYTDGQKIVLNPELPIFNELTIAEKVLAMIGNLAHEFFHIRYTDFRALERMWAMVSPCEQPQLKFYFNVIEDAAIELAGTSYYTGSFRDGINFVNDLCFKAAEPLEVLEQRPLPKLHIFDTACIQYCITGKVKGFPQDETIVELFKEAIPILEAGRLEKTAFGRLNKAKELFDLSKALWTNSSSDHPVEYPKNMEISSGGANSMAEPMPEDIEDFQSKTRKKTQEQFSEEKSPEECPGSAGSEEEAGGSDKAESGEEATASVSDGEEKDDAEESKTANSPADSSAKEGEPSDSTSANGDSAEEPADEESDFSSALESLSEQLEQVKEKAAEEEVERMWEEEKTGELCKSIDEVQYGDLHRSIRVETRLPARYPLYKETEYNHVYKNLSSMVRSFARKLKEAIRLNEDVEIYGLEEGELNQAQLWRKDGKIFFERRERSEEADLAVAVLVDESASMSQMMPHARKACIMLYEVCQTLGIPLAIIGHTAMHGERRVVMNHCVRFDHRNRNEKYNILNLQARDNTREGVALEYIGHILDKRSEQDKILIVISDGAPYHYSGDGILGGPLAIQDARNIVKKLERKDIKVIGVAIGEQRGQIAKIYSRHFIEIDDVRKLPMKLLKIIQRNLFKN